MGEAVVMGVVGVGMEGFLGELVKMIVAVVGGGALGDGLEDVAGWTV